MMVTLADLTRELAGLEFLHALETEREVREGAYHTGLASVVQLVARRGADGTGHTPDQVGGKSSRRLSSQSGYSADRVARKSS